ncbi:hypothetical protein [Streptomyces sp. AC495_CC817]|uniref:hypothetical protein n=1 Tax=Streptomyces sp. AC495_CC817 TaxID=2823900 RepID=UPI001C25A0E3|nr:hypothetical protein [Streptomyces sp. AC495_CC817]
MYAFASAESGLSDRAWAVFDARQRIDDAATALDVATGALRSLSADTAWRSEGIAALHRRIVDMAGRTADEAARLRGRVGP